jgi:hypothetical protein
VEGRSLYILGRERFSAKTVALVTAVTALPPLIAFWGTFDFARGFFASAYLAVCFFWYIVVQPKLACSNCAYYGKVCPSGLGKLSVLLYRPGPGYEVWGAKVARIFWRYWYAGVPVLGFAYLLVFRFSLSTAIFAVAFLAATALYFLVQRKLCCADCLVRNICRRSPFREESGGSDSWRPAP